MGDIIPSHKALKKCTPKFVQLFKSSRYGIQRLEISDNENEREVKILTLENCVKIAIIHPISNVLHIVTKSGQIQLYSPQENVIENWKTALQTAAFNEKQNLTQNVSHTLIEQDNELYSCSENSFIVNIMPTEASLKCNFEKTGFNLILSETEILLKPLTNHSFTVAKWPYRFIRKYGYRENKFTFEAGRKCDTGEGIFKLQCQNPQEIFRCLSIKMKIMKKHTTENCASPSVKNMSSITQYQINASTLCLEFKNMSEKNVDYNCSQTNTLNLSSIKVPPIDVFENSLSSTSAEKIFSFDTSRGFERINSIEKNCINDSSGLIHAFDARDLNYIKQTEDFQNYECIENITDAWKKLGVDCIEHTENLETLDLALNLKSESNFLQSSCKNKSDNEYDKLNYFRTVDKNNEENYNVPKKSVDDS
ncbi:uncharacterized protein LOC129737671 [Uranotaenia lowii]|uniref:uncharacterized protein LOC129737671 n=1 Tax=Uranotaenia lowii TaxID=190385 RepID=UPI0024795217|nr:uncharacterized protein LOC129737671 [Uranotaenia lowii]